jgi:hypothetical protein
MEPLRLLFDRCDRVFTQPPRGVVFERTYPFDIDPDDVATRQCEIIVRNYACPSQKKGSMREGVF